MTEIHWHFYEGLPHADQPDPEILDFRDWYEEALGARFISWKWGTTLSYYRDLTGVCGFDACDVDWVLWDEYQTTPTEYVAMIDAGHNYLWNGGAATSSTVPAANGTLVYRAVWEDNQTPPGAPDATKTDEITSPHFSQLLQLRIANPALGAASERICGLIENDSLYHPQFGHASGKGLLRQCVPCL